MPEKAKCKYCGKEVHKINLNDHEEECCDNSVIPKKKNKLIIPKTVDLDKELKTTGIILIIVGVLHIILSSFLNLTWGLVLIPIGFISLFYRSRRMLLVFGILLILVGILNLITSAENSMYSSGESSSSSFWTILAFFQIYWGIKEIIRFRKVKENVKYLIKEYKTKGFVWYSLRISFFILAGFWVIEKIITNIGLTFAILEWITLLFVLVISIIHLFIYNKKDFAVLSLGVSVVLLLLTGYTVIYTLFYAPNLEMSDLYNEVQVSNIENYCSSSCEDIDSATSYIYYYNSISNQIECECTNDYNETLKQSIVPDWIVQSKNNIQTINNPFAS